MWKTELDPVVFNDINVVNYRTHPRLIEVEFATVFIALARHLGLPKAEKLYKNLCVAFDIDYTKIQTLCAQSPALRNASTHANRKYYRQEAVLSGLLWGLSRRIVLRNLLGLSHSFAYGKDNDLNPEGFIDQTWLSGLANRTVLCGIETYRIEAQRFLEALFTLLGVFNSVPVSKVGF